MSDFIGYSRAVKRKEWAAPTLHWPVAQVVPNHLGLDFHPVEGLAVGHAHHAVHRVPQVHLHQFRLLHGQCHLPGLAQVLFSSACCFLRCPG